MTYRPTTLALVENHCPAALDFYEAGKPRDPRPFEVGIAAHAVLQAIGEETNRLGRQLDQTEVDALALSVAQRLVAVGRTFDGEQEPPLTMANVLAGRDLAVEYLTRWWPTIGASIELGIAVDRHWNRVDYYSPDAWLRCILDYAVVEDVEIDEESAARTLFIRDFKSSWAAGASELETIQRRVQAVLGWLHFAYQGPQRLVLEVANLRTGKVHELELWPTDDPEGQLARWRADIEAMLGALDQQKRLGHRVASPGACCVGCPYVLSCPWAQDYLEAAGIPGTAERRAVSYAVAHAHLSALAPLVREDAGDGSVPVPGGVVGYVAKVSRKVRSESYADLAAAWEDSGGDLAGFARAVDLTVSNVESVAKALHPDRKQKKERDAFVAALVEPETKSQFGVHSAAREESAA